MRGVELVSGGCSSAEEFESGDGTRFACFEVRLTSCWILLGILTADGGERPLDRFSRVAGWPRRTSKEFGDKHWC